MTNLPPAYHQPANRDASRILGFLGILVVAGLLWACADESGPPEDRRFANEPSTVGASTATPTTRIPVAAPTASRAEASPESLLDVRGAPPVIATLLDGAIHVIDTGSGAATRIAPPASYRFAAIAQSPVAAEVAVLLLPAAGIASGQPEVVIYDDRGQVAGRWSSLPVSEGSQATPVAAPDDVPRGNVISWSASGDRLLVTLGGSTLIGIETEGEASAVPMPAPFQGVVRAEWSPRGDQIALLALDERGTGVIWVFAPYVDGVSLRQIAPPNTDAADLGSVTTFSWLPDGSSLAYILAQRPGPDSAGGQLYTINIRLGVKLLVATPGRGGPAAEIVDFVVSPDGKSVAYTIAIPDGDGWQVHSLWVRSLLAPVIYDVPIGNVTAIDGLWFVDGGIAWQQPSESGAGIVVHSPGAGGNSVIPVDSGGGTLAATPDASPIMATPVAATPAATPVMTPLGGTPIAATPIGATPEATPAATPGG